MKDVTVPPPNLQGNMNVTEANNLLHRAMRLQR